MMETNTASCGGFPGLSDSFGGALWALDWAMQLAYRNFAGAFLHIGGRDVYYNVSRWVARFSRRRLLTDSNFFGTPKAFQPPPHEVVSIHLAQWTGNMDAEKILVVTFSRVDRRPDLLRGDDHG